ncbi:multiple epidermal growth factor-like domains protein 6 [Anguilla rostrata]|uniref:multiple epidermal growth factor-like domains protein 6 n=1 Tax=Anguilla rostrata TaxID=7938 RepID=UPI0030D1C95F
MPQVRRWSDPIVPHAVTRCGRSNIAVRPEGVQACPRGRSGPEGAQACPRGRSGPEGAQACPRGRSGPEGVQACPRGRSGPEGAQACPRGRSGPEGAQACPRGRSDPEGVQGCPRGRSGLSQRAFRPVPEGAQACPRGCSGPEGVQACPRGRSGPEGVQACPRGRSGLSQRGFRSRGRSGLSQRAFRLVFLRKIAVRHRSLTSLSEGRLDSSEQFWAGDGNVWDGPCYLRLSDGKSRLRRRCNCIWAENSLCWSQSSSFLHQTVPWKTSLWAAGATCGPVAVQRHFSAELDFLRHVPKSKDERHDNLEQTTCRIFTRKIYNNRANAHL